VRWEELAAALDETAAGGEQAVADAVRAAAVALQAPAPPEPPRAKTPARTLARVAGTVAGWIAFAALVLVWGALVVPATLLLSPVWPGIREAFGRLTRAAIGAFVKGLPFLRFRVEHAAPPLDGARVLVANHQSRLDSLLLMAVEGRLAGPVRGYMLRVPVVGAAIRQLGFFDADAGEAASFDAMNRAAARARERGDALLFYPEGTRSRDGEIGTFRRGAFRAAVDHDLPIQPVVIEGIEAVFPPGRAIAQADRSHLVRVRHLAPLHPPHGEGPRREVVRNLAARVRGEMVDALARMRAERRAARDEPPPAGCPRPAPAHANGREDPSPLSPS